MINLNGETRCAPQAPASPRRRNPPDRRRFTADVSRCDAPVHCRSPGRGNPMAAETEIRTFLCRSDNIGVLIRDPATGACAAIDVPEAGPVLKALDETGWRLTDILVTHRHGDHVEGIPAVKRATGARVVAPAKAGDAVPQVDVTVREGDTVRVGGLEAQVWETPGHCADHVTYWFAEAGARLRRRHAVHPGLRPGDGEPARDPLPIAAPLRRPSRRRPGCSAGTTTYSPTPASPWRPIRTIRSSRRASPRRSVRRRRGDSWFRRPWARSARPIRSCAAGLPVLARSVDMPPESEPEAVFVALRAWKNRF